MFEPPVLFGDIGGTNARFALLEAGSDTPTLLAHEHTKDSPDPVAAIRKALALRDGSAPRSAILAVAARVDRPAVSLTNAPWVLDGSVIGPALGLTSVAIVNDYVPVAAAPTRLAPGDLARIGPDMPAGRGGTLVLGPGTGFGAAALVPFGERFTIVSTEAGHVEFGPSDPFEAQLWPHIDPVAGRVTAETLLSGPGLVRIYRALAALEGGAPGSILPNDVIEHGLDGSDPVAVKTVDLFCRLLGRFVGDLVLMFGATAGVFISGGIAPRLVERLGVGGFRKAFERKAPFGTLMKAVPTFVITATDPALIGLTALATQPERFAYDGQFWRAG